MELLQTAMAFAVAMIIFSTIATGIVELIVRVCAFREKVLRRTLESLYDTVILPTLQTELSQLEADAKKSRNVFVQLMFGNPTNLDWQVPRKWRFWPPTIIHAGGVDRLSTLSFAERLARTDVGRAIVAEYGEKGRAVADELVTDFCRTFERFGRASGEVFRKWSNLTAMVVGVLLALTVNIDAGRLLSALAADADLRARLVAEENVAAVAAANRAAEERLAAELAKKPGAAPTADPAAAEGLVKPDAVAVVQTSARETGARVKAAQDLGLPIGWSYFPHCGWAKGASEEGRADASVSDGLNPACAAFAADLENGTWAALCKHFWDLARWFALSVVAGVLIGLGGPFWFKVFSSLSQAAQLLGAIGGRGRKTADAESPAPASSAGRTAEPENILDAFGVASRVAGRRWDRESGGG